MANPKKKHTRHRTGTRRSSNWKCKTSTLSKCSNCGKPVLPHTICLVCGFYGKRMVMQPKVKKEKKKEQAK
ncbi:50S ribosomal protein L32 [Elusimicrobiota bacterium]